MESAIVSGRWAEAREIISGLPPLQVKGDTAGIEALIARTSAILVSARIGREHLRSTLKSVNASQKFQTFD